MADGGPAFSVQQREGSAAPSGMSLRDYFAGQALVGVLANQELLMQADSHSDASTRMVAAEYAYAVADAMIEARAK